MGKEEAREVHTWLVYNEYILRGYRVHYHNYKVLFKSLFLTHNETSNIWSHLLGAIAFIGLLLYIFIFFNPFDKNTSLKSKANEYGAKNKGNFTGVFENSLKNVFFSQNSTMLPVNRKNKEGIASTQLIDFQSYLNTLRKSETELKQLIANWNPETDKVSYIT